MREIVDFLKEVEEKAFKLYSVASQEFTKDKKLSVFLNSLAEDEAMHFHYISSASEILHRLNISIDPVIYLDGKTMRKITSPLDVSLDLLNKHKLEKNILLNTILSAECSEWNDIFIYVINNFKKYHPTFGFIASQIQSHQLRLCKFLRKSENVSKDIIEKIEHVPKIWESQFLIVDDDPIIRDLFHRLFSKYFTVQTAGDGREGFHKAAQTYFDIIVSDIDMPYMSGLEFYEKLTTEHPDQKNSFIFITGDLNEERKKFGVLKGVRMFQKPFNLNTFKSFILETVEI